jgi:hypothetical protein
MHVFGGAWLGAGQGGAGQGVGPGMSDVPNGILIQQHQRYFHSIADHNSNDILDISKKRPISRQKWPANKIF